MWIILTGIFFELCPDLDWPAGAWLFSRLLGDPGSAKLAKLRIQVPEL